MPEFLFIRCAKMIKAYIQEISHEILIALIVATVNVVFAAVVGDRQMPEWIYKKLKVVNGDNKAAKQIMEYLEGLRKSFSVKPVYLIGTPFQIKVWEETLRIPYGSTVSYKALAEKLGIPKGARAIGAALGKNPIPIIVPCHRVLRSDGKIGGFSAGIEVKKRLLSLEAESKD